MVSSVKMGKAHKAISAARSYTQQSWNMLTRLAKLSKPEQHPFLQVRDEKKRICLIIVTSDRGLCGSYNTDVIKKTLAYQQAIKSANQHVSIDIVAVGKKGAEFIKKINESLIAEFSGFDLDVEYSETTSISKIALDGYAAKEYDEVSIIYSHFVSSLKQTPVVKQILPITEEHIDLPELWQSNESEEMEVKFEPNTDAILARIVPQFLRTQIFGAFIEANASEHSARMIAMKNATDNAKDLIDDLTLTYNSIRQDSITREIAEISGAAEAMK